MNLRFGIPSLLLSMSLLIAHCTESDRFILLCNTSYSQIHLLCYTYLDQSNLALKKRTLLAFGCHHLALFSPPPDPLLVNFLISTFPVCSYGSSYLCWKTEWALRVFTISSLHTLSSYPVKSANVCTFSWPSYNFENQFNWYYYILSLVLALQVFSICNIWFWQYQDNRWPRWHLVLQVRVWNAVDIRNCLQRLRKTQLDRRSWRLLKGSLFSGFSTSWTENEFCPSCGQCVWLRTLIGTNNED